MKKLVPFIGVLGVSFSAIFVRWSTAPSGVLVVYRMALAALMLLIPVLIKCRSEIKSLKLKTVGMCALSGIALAAHFTFYFESLSHTSIAASSVLINTEVLFVAFAGLLFFRDKLRPAAWAGIALAFGGSVLIALLGKDSQGSALSGDLLALGGAAAGAAYTVIGSRCRRHISTLLYTFTVYIFAALTSALVLIIRGIPLFGWGTENLFTSFGMALVCTIMGHNVFSWCLRHLNASYVSTTKLAEPLVASLLGLAIFGEVPGIFTVVGGVIVIAGIFIYSKSGSTELRA